ncbi:hypothetical protein [Enterobacter hormaechei]|uniref:hypothetical protein n=1 Tax=Enterobacter hormaechei TaxID=158836 RepID=UPI002FE4FC79
MDKQTIQNIMQFMLRVNLTGHEVPAFNESMNALQAELNREDNQSLRQVVDADRAESEAERVI